MSPIRFSCTEVLPTPASAIVDQILDIEQWTSFTGYGPVPAIRSTKLLHRAPEVIGTRFEVTNAEGSRQRVRLSHPVVDRSVAFASDGSPSGVDAYGGDQPRPRARLS